MSFVPNYHYLLDVLGNRRPARLPLYEHIICPEIMDEVIALGINAKHSNEDAIAPFERWIEDYGNRIGLLGGIDLDILCQKTPEEIYETVLERGRRFRALAQGFALGSGNSIPDYVPVEGYLAMVRAGQALRAEEER